MQGHNAWMYFAEGDLVAARLCVQEERALAGSFYHCQQSAEKALKAFIVFNNKPVIRTHDLEYLLELCVALDKEFNILLQDVQDLNPFSQKTRYPENDYLLPSIDTAEICIKKAETILEFVKQKLNA